MKGTERASRYRLELEACERAFAIAIERACELRVKNAVGASCELPPLQKSGELGTVFTAKEQPRQKKRPKLLHCFDQLDPFLSSKFREWVSGQPGGAAGGLRRHDIDRKRKGRIHDSDA